VMGRDAGFIALRSGIAAGAESVLVPEVHTDMQQLIDVLQDSYNRKKTSSIVVVAEGDDAGGAYDIATKVKEQFNYYEIKVTVLGHTQRGGSPTCMDRVLASRLGIGCVDALRRGISGVMVGQVHREIKHTLFDKAIKHHAEMSPSLLRMAEILAS